MTIVHEAFPYCFQCQRTLHDCLCNRPKYHYSSINTKLDEISEKVDRLLKIKESDKDVTLYKKLVESEFPTVSKEFLVFAMDYCGFDDNTKYDPLNFEMIIGFILGYNNGKHKSFENQIINLDNK